MSGDEGQPADQAALDHAAIRAIVLGILLAMLLAALDQTIVATALPTIGRELGDLDNLSWVVTAYLLTSTAVTPLYGKLADIRGRRVTLLIGIGTFVVGSVACALAPSMLTLILARAAQGLGGGGLISLAQTIIGDVVAPKERGRYQAYIASVFATSSIAGPPLGGLIAEHLHWSVVFWINLPLGLLAFAMTNTVLRRLPRYERRHRLDLAGAALMMLATVLLLLALSFGGTRYAWGSLPLLALLAASALVWSLFVLRLVTAAEPLLPLGVVLDPVVAAGTGAACCAMGVFIGLSIYVPIWLQSVQGLSVSSSGLALIALTAGTVAGATASGRVMLHVRHYRRMPVCGLAVAAIGLASLAIWPSGTSLATVELVLLAIGLGAGTVLPVTTVSVQNAVPLHQLGTATATMNFFRSLGGAIVVAAFGAILLGHVGGHASTLLHAEAVGVPTGAPAEALRQGFRWMFIASALGLVAALACLLAMEERPLRGSAPKPDEAG
jgi:EmrB/QacA subfamily drug resistance transporter